MKNKLLLIIVLIFPSVSKSWQCKIDENALDKSYWIPSLAKTVSIGVVKEENSKMFFVSSKPWVSFKIPVTTEGCVGILGLKKNEKYLFVSEQTQEMLVNKSLDRTNGSLKIVALLSSDFIEEISNQNEMPVKLPNIFWRYCVGDRSCQKVAGSCGDIVSLNYKYAEKYKNYSIEKNKNKKCETKQESIKLIPAKCVNSFCS